jgi:hypothetical protein
MAQKISGIYEIRNIVNNKVYIGCSSNIKIRWRTHKTKLRAGTHENSYLQRAFNKNGEEKFQFKIIEEVNIDDKLVNIEQKWLDDTKCYERDKGYNLAQRGSRKTTHYICTVDDCSDKHLSNGLCNKHYRRMRRRGSLELPPDSRLPQMKNRGCLVEGCVRKHDSHGYCTNHMHYIRTYGQIQEPKVIHGRKDCLVNGCDRPHKTNGFCHAHSVRHDYRKKVGIPEDYELSKGKRRAS